MNRRQSSPSRMVVIEKKSNGQRFLVDLLRGQTYDKELYTKITYEIPLREEYWDLPRLTKSN